MKNSIINFHIDFDDDTQRVDIGAYIHDSFASDPSVMEKIQDLFDTIQLFFMQLDEGKTIRDMTDEERKAALDRAAANKVMSPADEG